MTWPSSNSITVGTRDSVDFFFGSLLGRPQLDVSAKATASRACVVVFRSYSDTTIGFAGGGSSGAGMYARFCFDGSNGTGGNFPVVGVGVDSTYPDCQAHNPPITPLSKVDLPLYNVVYTMADALRAMNVTPNSPPDGTSLEETTAAGAPGVVSGTCGSAAVQSAIEANGNVYCSGNLTGGNAIKTMFTGRVWATGNIVVTNTGAFGGAFMEAGGDVDIKTAVTGGGVIVSKTGTIKTPGSGTAIDAVLIARVIEFAGGDQVMGTGFILPGAGGEVSLTE